MECVLTHHCSYVRLFLRKTDAWHRSDKLGYYNDIANPDDAIATLQTPRELPKVEVKAIKNPITGTDFDEVELQNPMVFADTSVQSLTSIEDAASLLLLDELKAVAKEVKVQGKNKSDIIRALSRAGQQQQNLKALGISRHNSGASGSGEAPTKGDTKTDALNQNQGDFIFALISDILGPCVRLSSAVLKLFQRVHLVFYRSTEWTEKSLTTIILAKIARRNFPEYLVCRSCTIFSSRAHLVEYETAIRLEVEIDQHLEGAGTAGAEHIISLFETLYPRWQKLIQEEAEKELRVYDTGEGAYLRRFNPAHPYTRLVSKCAGAFGQKKQYVKERDILIELLDQKLFHLARRGGWYQRKALIEENYMWKLDEQPTTGGTEVLRKHWNRTAAQTCEAALQDRDCHLIFHHDLQKRLSKLEKKLRVPHRLQHDFSHVRLSKPLEFTVSGTQIKKDLPIKPGSTAPPPRTMWLDELDTGEECTVEELCLSHFRQEKWKGYHAEGGIVRTLFAYLFYDILFLYIPNVFQTEYQTCPLDLHTDAFMPARASEINHRLVEIANGEAERILRQVWAEHNQRRTAAIGLNWDFAIDDLVELVQCFEGNALAALCKVMAQEYKQRGGGIPDLLLWRLSEQGDKGPAGTARGEVMFVEVKSPNDRLSETQRLWMHVLAGSGIPVALCNVVAARVREVF